MFTVAKMPLSYLVLTFLTIALLSAPSLQAKKQKEKAFFELAERFRAAEDPKEIERLGEELGQMAFGR